MVRAHQDGADVRSKPTSPAVPSPGPEIAAVPRRREAQTTASVVSSCGAGGDNDVFVTCSWKDIESSTQVPEVQEHEARPGAWGHRLGIVRATVPDAGARPVRRGPGQLKYLNVQISTPDLTVRTGAKVQTETRTGDAGATRTPHIRRDISVLWRRILGEYAM